MYKNLVIAAALLASISSFTSFSAATATTNNEVCKPLDSGKIDLGGNLQSITLHAPEGKVITGYCVKAGSTKHGDGPKYITGLKSTSVTITYPGGKAISHYSLSYGVKTAPNHQDANVAPVTNGAPQNTPADTTPSGKSVDAKATPTATVIELPKTGSNGSLSMALAAGVITAIVTAIAPIVKKACLRLI